jgi:hypothetical protein
MPCTVLEMRPADAGIALGVRRRVGRLRDALDFVLSIGVALIG